VWGVSWRDFFAMGGTKKRSAEDALSKLCSGDTATRQRPEAVSVSVSVGCAKVLYPTTQFVVDAVEGAEDLAG
jgi:hypothetical protein